MVQRRLLAFQYHQCMVSSLFFWFKSKIFDVLGIITKKLRQWSGNGKFTCAVDTETVFMTRLNVGSYVLVKRGVQ